MKFSEKWLREWVDPEIDTRALADRLTMAGLEVDAVEPVAPPFSGVVVGRVLEVAPHPQADRLRVCRVDDGSPQALSIVCGAPNVRAEMRVPLARIGARLPGSEQAIRRARLRGVESEGMLCSARELGLGEAGEGLMELAPDAPPGADVREMLGLDDVSIELGITPNRGDCLGIAGIAREVGVLCRLEVREPPAGEVPAEHDEVRAVALAAPEGCPAYLGRVIRGIDPGARTPFWMQERLRRSGVRSLGPVVDVTNYVLLELGQPMHAFDLDRLAGGIHARWARAGETIALLDGQTAKLTPDMLVISDDARPVALAGIMGGAQTAVGDGTNAIFLECAWFAPAAIAGRARRLGLHTDSSHRFERGVDPALQRRAIERATRLIVDICGGTAGPVVEARSAGHLPVRSPVRLRAARLERVLGVAIARDEVEDILRRLGMRIAGTGDEGWEVVPPSFRFDIAIEADLIEEVARIHGYESLPAERPRGPLGIRSLDGAAARIREARAVLAHRGYREAITYTFVDEEVRRRFDPDRASLKLTNPISADTAVMRTTLWAGLAQAALRNLNRQQSRVRLFEYGTRFLLQPHELEEQQALAVLAAGDAWEEQWGLPRREMDFHDLKGDLEAVLGALGAAGRWHLERGEHPALHPMQSARILGAEGVEIGWIGRVHPHLVGALDFPRTPFVFEIVPALLGPGTPPAFRELSRFPAVRRDLAIVVDADVAAGEVMACVRDAAGPHLNALTLFDIYQGKGVDSGKKSLALGLTFQEISRTLTDAEIEVSLQGVLKALQDRWGATLRE